MEVHKGNIFGILNGDKQFLIPVYHDYSQGTAPSIA